MQTTMLTDLVVIANLKPGFFTGILKILTNLAHTGELENFIIFTYTRIATHHYMGMKFATRTNSDVWPNDTVWTNFYISSDDCLCVNNGSWMNKGIIAHACSTF